MGTACGCLTKAREDAAADAVAAAAGARMAASAPQVARPVSPRPTEPSSAPSRRIRQACSPLTGSLIGVNLHKYDCLWKRNVYNAANRDALPMRSLPPVSYTHLRAH